MLRKNFAPIMIMAALIALQACTPRRAPEPVILYPSLPTQPRLAYRAIYWGEDNFREPSFFDMLFGYNAGLSLQKPYGVAVHGSKIFVTMASPAMPGVAIFDLEKRTFKTLSDYGREKFNLPTGIAVTQDGAIFVSDSGNRRVIHYDGLGKSSRPLGGAAEFQTPSGIAVNNSLGRVYIVDSYGHCVKVFSFSGEKLFEFGENGRGNGQFHFPTNVAIDRTNGNVAVVDTQNFRVQIFDKDGAFLRTFGEVGDRPGTFARPKGIGIDSEGHLYIADAAFSNVQIFDDTGQLMLFFGELGRGPGEFVLPAGMYIDENDSIYVVDSLNGRIEIFQYFSEKWIKANPEEYARLTGPDLKK